MTRRCQHRMLEITEEDISTTMHSRDNEAWSHDSNYGKRWGRIEVICHDCGFWKTYIAGAERPVWVEQALYDAKQDMKND